MEKVFLSRRNLLMLLSKLDRKAAGEETECTIIKCDNEHPKYPQTMDLIGVTALEDDEYYTDRTAGAMHSSDEIAVAKQYISKIIPCSECNGTGLVEGDDFIGGCATFETCHSCKGDK